jgi:hypothetical protein
MRFRWTMNTIKKGKGMNCDKCSLCKAERSDCNCQIIASLIRYRLYNAREIEDILKVLKAVTSERFFGALVIEIEAGRIAYIKKMQRMRL